jgi:predicted transcriptional regulator
VRISQIGKASKSALKIHEYLLKKPYLAITKVAAELDISVPSTTSTVQKLVDIGVLKEMTGKSRNRIFAYEAYLDILAAGTEQARLPPCGIQQHSRRNRSPIRK